MMALNILKTASTPKVTFNNELQTLSLIGRSFPENAREFYSPIIDWMKANTEQFSEKLILEVNLEYYNTASSKFLMEIFHLLESFIEEKKIDVLIKWFYMSDDEDMKDAGEEYKQFIHIPFECIEFE
jgi:hypothetical protein